MSRLSKRLAFLRFRVSDYLDRLWTVILRAVRERIIQVTLVMVLALLVANVLVAETSDVSYLEQSLSTLIAVIVTFLSVYFSIDVLAPYLKHSERTRISGSESVTDAYDDDVLLSLERWLPEANDWSGSNSPIAAGIEDVPETPHSLDEVNYDFRGEMYEVPDDVWGVIEPAVPEMREIFEREGFFSELKPRLDEIADGDFHLSKTTYYRSFQTNFCPDLDLGSGRSLRELTESELVDDGELVPLEDSPFSNHLGAAGLVVSADGVTVLSTRSGQVAVDKFATSLSFSGALTLEELDDEGEITSAVLEEMEEELNIPESAVKESVYLGTTRRMERLGKPDVLTLVLVDEVETWENPTEEFTKLNLVELDSQDRFDSVSQLLEPETADELVQKIQSRIEMTSRHASIGLLSFLALYSRLVDQSSGNEH